MSGIIEGVIKLFGNLFAWLARRNDLKNTSDMKKNDEAKKDAKSNDKIEKIIKDEDVRKTQELLGE